MSYLRRANPIHFCTLALLASLIFVQSELCAQEVDAATRAAARDLGTEGVAAYQAGDFPKAEDRLERAYRVLNVPSLGLWYGRALVQQGKLLEAAEIFLAVSRLEVTSGDRAVQDHAQKEAIAERGPLLPRIGALRIELENADPKGVEVTIDGMAVAAALLGMDRPTNPGSHQVVGKRGSESVELTVTLVDGEKKAALLRFAPAAPAVAPPVAPPAAVVPAAPAPQPDAGQEPSAKEGGIPPWVTYVAWGVGGVGVLAGATTATLAYRLRQSDTMTAACDGNVCSPAVRSDVDQYNNLRTVSTVGFIVGGVGLAAAATLTWALPGAQESPAATGQRPREVRAWLGATSVGMSGTF